LTTRSYGIYVHFPWCTFRCPYCDFAVTTERPVPSARYARTVVEEIRMRAPAFRGQRCATLYLGGGTPSLWEPEDVARVVAAARDLGLPGGAEVTLEANPESVDPGRARAWRRAGVNRVSVGAQSFDAAVLRKLGRRHGPEDADRALRAAARAIPRVAVDLLYGGRRSSAATARADAERVASLPVTHVSAYALTLDAEVLAEDVPFARLARRGRLEFPGEEEVLAQGEAIREVLERAGLRRYEVSNFARPGFESRHNLLYWRSASYLGAGAGAVGCLHLEEGGALRWTNHRGVAEWFAAVEAGRTPAAAEELLSPLQVRNERLMLALRTAEGLDAAALAPEQAAALEGMVRGGLAARSRGRVVLTARGLDLHSAVAARLFE